jgi:hypothetical protein
VGKVFLRVLRAFFFARFAVKSSYQNLKTQRTRRNDAEDAEKFLEDWGAGLTNWEFADD